MAGHSVNIIYPCPFSKGYGMAVDQAWTLLTAFFIYRIIISSLFVGVFYHIFNIVVLVDNDTRILSYFSQIYFGFTVFSGCCVFWRWLSYPAQAQIGIFVDIVSITLLMHASGGIQSGIGMLLIVSIAAGGLLIGGRCALLFAALASLSILTEQFYTMTSNPDVKISFSYAGILGVSFFTVAYLCHVSARRVEQAEVLASLNQQKLVNLEELNQNIIQQFQSGIIISNSRQQIKMCNKAALSVIYHARVDKPVCHLADISLQISDCFALWLSDEQQNFALVRLANHMDVHLRFSLLNTQHETFYMIVLEDNLIYNQRLNQDKLASLGRVTAGIAHEIRNPLGAISHAGQLLSESVDLSVEDMRLIEIIHKHSQRVNKIIEDILQLSRTQPFNTENINIRQWIVGYLKNFTQNMNCDPDNFIIVAKEADLWCFIDEGHLTQILNNLCSNALKYGNLTAKIIIEVGESDDYPYIKVMDNGIRIDEEIALQLFEPFFTTSLTGTGLGLYISKELAELNRAKLSYARTGDELTSFQLTLSRADISRIEI
ncbi:MAG: HAMP domain-containing sensor histidine kinase [Gammaproteobacteria bacterium]